MSPSTPHRSPEDASRAIAGFERSFPGLKGTLLENGKVRITLEHRLAYLWVDYWAVAPGKGIDPWTYQLSHRTEHTPYAGTACHPTEKGCWIMARKYFAENGLMPVPQDNSHLSPKTRAIALCAQKNRTHRAQSTDHTPEVGDMIMDNHGQFRRICTTHGSSCQTTTALERSFYTSESGTSSYSGGCGSSVKFGELTLSQDTTPALFWTFRDGIAGAGRAAEFWLDVTIWDFQGTFGQGQWWDKGN